MRLPSKIEMLVVANDFQLLRNCEVEALGAWLKFLERYKDKITHLVLNGDILDMEQASKFAHSPDMAGTMADEIAAGQWLFNYLSKLCPRAEKVLIDGNHEARWNNYLSNADNGLEGWLENYETKFNLKKLGWKHIPYGKGNYYKWHNRIFFHGARAAAKSNNAKGEQSDALFSTTTAHTNRNEYWQQRTVLGEYLTSYTHAGFSRDNLPYVKKANSGWAMGFGIYEWHPSVGEQVYSVEIKHGNPSFIYNGEIFSGKGYKIPFERR